MSSRAIIVIGRPEEPKGGSASARSSASFRSRIAKTRASLGNWFERNGVRVAAAAVLLGAGWTIGAASFSDHAAMDRLDAEVSQLRTRLGTVGVAHRNAVDIRADAEIRALQTRIADLEKQQAEGTARLSSAERASLTKLDAMQARVGRLEKQVSSPAVTASILKPPVSSSLSSPVIPLPPHLEGPGAQDHVLPLPSMPFSSSTAGAEYKAAR